MERGRGSYRGRGRYGGGRSSYDGRDGNAGRSSSGGRDSGRRGRFYQPSQPQPQWKPRWQPRSNPSPGESSEPYNSHPQVETETQTETQTQTQTETPRPAIHNPDVGSLRISEEKVENIRPMHRPDTGGVKAARTHKLEVNHFHVEFDEERVIYHYDVDVKARTQPMNNRPPPKISKSRLSLIRNRLSSDHSFPSSAYDGEKNIFSVEPLQEETFEVDVIEEDRGTVGYSVNLTLVKVLELRKLRDYLSGSVFSIPRDVLQGLDLVVKENPAKQCYSFGRCFFPKHPPTSPRRIRGGILATGGFQQSLKPTSQGLSLCLDYSVLAYVGEDKWVLDFLHEQIPHFNLRNFQNFKKRVETLLVGLKVNVTHRKTKQKYTITRLTPMVTRDIRFPVLDTEGRNPTLEYSLIDYFSLKYGVTIEQRDIPALDFGGNKMNYVPMELCRLVKDQRCPKKNLSDINASNALREMSVAPPGTRRTRISTIVNSNEGPCGGGVIESFGMRLHTSMTQVTGRVIQPPVLKIGNGHGQIISMPLAVANTQWNLKERSMVEGKPLKCWGILYFYRPGERNTFRSKQFIENIISKYRVFGIGMEEPACNSSSVISTLGNYNSLCELLEDIDCEVQKKCGQRLQFLLCVMGEKHSGYKCLKWIAETKVGLVTQCSLCSHANDGKDQYLTNLALKINAKIGGSNVELMNRLPNFDGEGHVMFIGADVNHPASRDINSPSIASVVATVNWPAANRYAARVCAQGHRVEKILNFGTICRDLVSYYNRLNKVWPEKIVIFRDGVSESQFQMVLTEELQDLKSVFGDSNYLPTITLIVAQKRHQTRLFVKDQNVNVVPGTVVDTEVVHPFEFDFYLCSHRGVSGTSKPTHYHVLWDEHKFTSDDLQKLIYEMCFTFARCTGPVSLVPPVYYADLAAYRGRLYYEAKIEMQSAGSASASSSSSVSTKGSSLYDLECYKLHPDVENQMFFI